MRTTQKRKRSNGAFVAMKRRALMRRRRVLKRRRNDKDISTRTTNARNAQPKGRILPKRLYRRKLWDFTRFHTKFKAISSSSSALNTPASFSNVSWSTFECFDNANPFWTSAGGLQPVHQGGAVPTLSPETVVIRGGTIKMSFVVGPAITDDIMVRYQLIYPKQQITRYNSLVRTNVPLVDWLAAIPGTQADDWSLTDAGDYEQFFYPPVLDKRIVLKPGDYNETRHTLKIRRIDADLFSNGAQLFPRVVVYAKNCANNAAVTLGTRLSYNISFCVLDV